MKAITILLLSMFVIVMVSALAASAIYMVNKVNPDSNYTRIRTPDPSLRSSDFVSRINNKYMTLIPGTLTVFEGQTDEGKERVEVLITRETKKIMGVNTIVVHDKEYLNGELIEDTKGWFAQDKYGNVWYFGEESEELLDGKVVSTKGSWKAGVKGAAPGIVMKANPQVGDLYRQEYFPGEAEDMAEITALGVQIKVTQGSYTDCVQIKEWNPLESDSEEFKYHCPGVGLVYEISTEDGESKQLIEIIKISKKKTTSKTIKKPELNKDITKQEAISIALRRVPGNVIDVEIEKKFGKPTYVIEIDNGDETDIIVDIETGSILGVET